MRPLGVAILCFTLAGCQAKKSASLHIDPTLESLVPADTVMVVGANVDAVRETSVYQKLLARLPLPQLEEFSRQTGLDPRKDLSQALFCWDGKHGLFMARGQFRPADLEARLKSKAATQFSYKNHRLFGNEQNAIVFLNDSTVAAGPANELRSVIDRGPTNPGLPPALAELLRTLPGNDQIYAALIGGIAGLELVMPKADVLGNVAQVLQAVDSAALGMDLEQRHRRDCAGQLQDRARCQVRTRHAKGPGGIRAPERARQPAGIAKTLRCDPGDTAANANRGQGRCSGRSGGSCSRIVGAGDRIPQIH